PTGEASTGVTVVGGIREQVAEALVGLGFTAGPAEKAVTTVLAENPDADASTALRHSLSLLGKAS
ncbi:RuvA C-terminal domain-containing protein, partial [Gordonia sp. GAMMA]